MVAKIGLTTDTLRGFTGFSGNSSDALPASHNTLLEKKINLSLNGIATAATAFFSSAFGLRLNLVNRLLTDKQFSEEFMNGAFKHIHENHAAEYAKSTFSPENFKDIWPNTKNHYRLTFGLAKELKEKGIGWSQAWKGLSSLEKIGVVAAPVIAVGFLAQSIYNYLQKPKENNEIMISTPAKFMGNKSVQNLITELNKEGIPVGTHVYWPDGMNDTSHGVTTGEFEGLKSAEFKNSRTGLTAKSESFTERRAEDKERVSEASPSL